MSQPDYATYATQAELALAAYAEFGKDVLPVDSLRRVSMTDLQAADFLTTWKPVVQINSPLTGVSATIFEHMSNGKRSLAISWVQPGESSDPGEIDKPAAGVSLKPDQLYKAIKAQVVEWIDTGVLPQGSTVSGHNIGGYLAIALKHEFPDHIFAAFSFLGDKSTTVYGVSENGVLTTDTHKSALDLTLFPAVGEADAQAREQTLTQDLQGADHMKRLAALLVVLELMTGCNMITKMQMDAEVDRLCAIDGGIKVYETVTLPRLRTPR